jgi:hypothetical protein
MLICHGCDCGDGGGDGGDGTPSPSSPENLKIPPLPPPPKLERKFIFMYRKNCVSNISFFGKQNSFAKFFSAKALMEIQKNIACASFL